MAEEKQKPGTKPKYGEETESIRVPASWIAEIKARLEEKQKEAAAQNKK